MVKIDSGVYQIRNLINNKRYIGSAVDIDKRWKRHRHELNKGIHHSIHLQRAWNKHSNCSFVFEILEKCFRDALPRYEFRKPLLAREQYYKDLYKSYDRKYGYDICKIAGSTLGSTHSEETRRKISESMKGACVSEETRRKIGKANAIVHRGMHHSEETKQKIGAASKLRNSGENNPWFGRHPSEETRRKMSESVKKSWALRRRNQC